MAEIQYLEINDITRMINVPANLLLGVREDKDVKKLYFKCKKIVEKNVDLSKHQIYVKYINALDKSGKKFDIMDPKICLCGDVTTQGDYITFSWLMSENVFAKAGLIAFSILASDGEKTRWNTYTAIGTVLNSVPGGLQEIAGKYPDIITQLLNRMREVEKIATKEAMQEYVNTYLTEHPGEIDETLTDPKKAAPADVVGSLKEDINNITEEITIPGWCKIGYYSGEEHNTTHGVSLFFEIPKHVKQIRVVANGRAYFNDYTFINEDDNIVSYGAKLTQDKDIDVLIDVPGGATKVVVGGKIEDCDSASVFYKATVKKETEVYIKRLIGKRSKIFFTVGVRSEGSVDNSIYYDVANAISITVNGTFEQRKDIATFIDNNGVLVGSVSATVTGSTKKTISVPKKAKTVYISTTYQNLNSAVVFGKYEIEQSNLKGKKIVWFGTSIPAGGKNGIEVADSYPVYIGKMLDATVYNEAVGSSCLHCKNKNRISERNPYGFVENFEGVSRCLTNTLDEMEWIIAHYNDTDVFTKNVPFTLSDEDKEFIRSCSYEKKINKYLTENNFPDLWIIDHGHNDTISDAQELQYEPMEMPWEAKTGFYQKGVLKTSAGKHLIEIDVDGFDMVYLSGVFNVGYDIYDIFDADGKVKKFEYANITKTVENLEIDCRGASRVAFSTETDKLETVIIKAKSTENLYCYQGAFDFIVKKIKEFNQKAEIYMIGEYENQLRPAISNYQIKTSERWSFPLFKAWNMYGWSQKKIKCTGYWSDGIWVEDGIERETTFLNRWLPDTIHPHSDKSGEALWYMAKYISAWLKNLIN